MKLFASRNIVRFSMIKMMPTSIFSYETNHIRIHAETKLYKGEFKTWTFKRVKDVSNCLVLKRAKLYIYTRVKKTALGFHKYFSVDNGVPPK